MLDIITVGLDLAKNVFQVHGSDGAGRAVRALGWEGMLLRKPPMLVRVALANKTARIVWALMVKKEVYRAPSAAA